MKGVRTTRCVKFAQVLQTRLASTEYRAKRLQTTQRTLKLCSARVDYAAHRQRSARIGNVAQTTQRMYIPCSAHTGHAARS
eukprot:6172344-Pleurochrysis_carterae.AAC.5